MVVDGGISMYTKINRILLTNDSHSKLQSKQEFEVGSTHLPTAWMGPGAILFTTDIAYIVSNANKLFGNNLTW